MFDKPAARHQASPRPPRADHVEVDVGAEQRRRREGAPRGRASGWRDRTGHRPGPPPTSRYAGDLVAFNETWVICRSPCVNTGVHGRSAASATWRLRVTRSAGNTPFATSHSHGRRGSDATSSKPYRAMAERRVMQSPNGGTRRGPRRRGHGRRLAEAAKCRPPNAGERKDRGLPRQDLRSRDRRHSHRLDLDVGPRLVGVDLQEHVADTQGRPFVMGDDDLDLFHIGDYRGMTTDVAPGLSAPTPRGGRFSPRRGDADGNVACLSGISTSGVVGSTSRPAESPRARRCTTVRGRGCP